VAGFLYNCHLWVKRFSDFKCVAGDVLQHLSHRKLDKSSIAREKLNLCTRPCEEGRYTLLNVLEDARSCFLLGIWSISFVSCVSRTF
jgi:hypothetical protein